MSEESDMVVIKIDKSMAIALLSYLSGNMAMPSRQIEDIKESIMMSLHNKEI